MPKDEQPQPQWVKDRIRANEIMGDAPEGHASLTSVIGAVLLLGGWIALFVIGTVCNYQLGKAWSG